MVDHTECGEALLPASADFRVLFQSICYILLHIELYIHTHLSYPRVIDRCIHACMYACRYACMFVFKHICMYVCTHVRMYVCMYVCMLVRVYVSMRVSMSINKREKKQTQWIGGEQIKQRQQRMSLSNHSDHTPRASLICVQLGSHGSSNADSHSSVLKCWSMSESCWSCHGPDGYEDGI